MRRAPVWHDSNAARSRAALALSQEGNGYPSRGVGPLLGAALMALFAVPLAASDWPTLCHDQARTGITTDAGPSKGAIAWATPLGDSVDGSPIVVGDRVYVGTAGGDLFAVDKNSGAVVWRQTVSGPILCAAEIGGDQVFASSVDGFVYAFEVASGGMRWRHRVGRPVLAAPTFCGDRLVVGGTDGVLRALDPTTGRTLWRVEATGPISAAPAVRGEVLFVGDEGGGLAARRLADGAALWSTRLAGRVIAAPTLCGDSLVVPLMSLSALAPPATEYLTAWSVADGRKLWSVKPAPISVMGTPVCYDQKAWGFGVEGYVSEGKLKGLSLADGTEVAELKLGLLVVDACLAVASETLYIAGQRGVIHFVNARTGAPVGQVALGGPLFSSPAISDGRLYIGCQDGKLYCIE